MTDVYVVYAAAISAAAAITGAAVPLVTTALREERGTERARQEQERARQEQLAQARHDACVQLLSTVLRLKVLVENNHQYHGPELAERLAEIRQCAADAQVEAVRVALMVPLELADSAQRLAETAGRLADTVTAKTSLAIRGSAEAPDFNELDKGVHTFRELAMADRYPATPAGPGAGPAHGGAVTGAGLWRRPRAWPVLPRRSHRR